MKKIILSLITVILLGSLSFAADFVDVAPTHWAKDSVYKLQNWGVTNGYPDRTFRGDKALTRYELAVYLSLYDQHLQKNLEDLKRQVASLSSQNAVLAAKCATLETQLHPIKK